MACLVFGAIHKLNPEKHDQKSIKKMQQDWQDLSAEQQAQANEGCQILLDKFSDMLAATTPK